MAESERSISMKVTGEATIFRNAHDGKNGTWYTYSAGVSSKREDGSYANGYLDVRFRKGVEVENKTKIDIKHSFLTVREFTVDGKERKKIELMILQFDIVSGEDDEEYDVPSSNQPGFSAFTDDDIPF